MKPQQYKENVSRRNGYFYHEIYASNVPGVLVNEKVEELDSWLLSQDFGGDIKYGFQGQAEETEEVNEGTNDREEETVADDLAETESDDTNSNKLEPEVQEEVDWDKPSDEEDGWAVGW